MAKNGQKWTHNEVLEDLWKIKLWNVCDISHKVTAVWRLKIDCSGFFKSCDGDANKDTPSFILQVPDRKSGSSQFLQRPITRIMLLVENHFDFPTKSVKQLFQVDRSSWTKQMK